MIDTIHRCWLAAMSHPGADPRAVDSPAREGLGITIDPAKSFLPIGSAASPLARTASFWRIHGLVPHLR